jgi:outer membrane protein OmpA-like peptidoglycan-associated protein
MFLSSKYSYNNTPSGLAVSYKKRDGSWSKPEPLNISNLYNKNKFVCYHVSIDAKVIVMSLERDDTKGELDLYVSFRYADGSYSAPVNMGEDVNSVGDEASVFLAADGKTIYFASNGHSGFGDYDMYMSRRLDNSWKRWSEPVNLGDKINTPGIDIYYTIPAKGDYAYFSSSGYGYGQNDLFRILLPKEVRPESVSITEGLYASDIPANLPTIPTTAVAPAVVTAVPQPVAAKPITEPKAMVPANAEPTTDLDARIAELKRQLQGQQSPASSKSASITVATPTSNVAEPKPDYSAPKAANVFENYTPTEQVDPAYDNQINELKRQLELTKLNTPAPKYSTPTKPATSVSQTTPAATLATPSTPAATVPVKSKEILAMEEKLKKAEAALEKTKARPQEVQEPIRIAKSEKPPVEAPVAVQIEKPLVKEVLADAKETPTNQEKSNNVTYTPIVIPSETTQSVVKETPVLVSNEPKIAAENLPNADSLNALRASLENEINQLTLAKEKEAQQALAHQKATEKLNNENQTLSSEKEKIAAEIAALEAERAKIQSEKLKLEKEKSQLEALRQQQFNEINQRKRQIDSLQNAQIAAAKAAPTTYVAFEDELNIPLQVGTTVQLKNVYFVANAAFLQDKSFAELDKLVAFLKKNKQLKVEIGGHTNGICDDAFCVDLSSRRAKTVLDYLVQKGIAATQLSAKGYGKSQPIADNYTDEGRKMNQRVEIKIVSVN